jgi:hypothetical protein
MRAEDLDNLTDKMNTSTTLQRTTPWNTLNLFVGLGQAGVLLLFVFRFYSQINQPTMTMALLASAFLATLVIYAYQHHAGVLSKQEKPNDSGPSIWQFILRGSAHRKLECPKRTTCRRLAIEAATL